jgi:hypothetical protein
MNLKVLTTDLTKCFDQLNIGLIADPGAELAHVMNPDQCRWVIRRHFNGPTGLFYALVMLSILGAVIGFALYARQ